MDKNDLILNRIISRLENFIEDGSFDENDKFDCAYRLGLGHALQIVNDCIND